MKSFFFPTQFDFANQNPLKKVKEKKRKKDKWEKRKKRKTKDIKSELNTEFSLTYSLSKKSSSKQIIWILSHQKTESKLFSNVFLELYHMTIIKRHNLVRSHSLNLYISKIHSYKGKMVIWVLHKLASQTKSLLVESTLAPINYWKQRYYVRQSALR